MPNEALFTQGGTYDAAELRKLIKGIWYSASPGGVVDGLAVTVGGALSISVAPGFAKIDDTTNGAYLGYATTSNSVAISSNSGGGGTRNDTIYAKANDPGSGGTAGELVIAVATGTTTIPSLAIPLANVAVTTGNALTVTNGARILAEPLNAAARGAFASLAARLANMDTLITGINSGGVTLSGTQVLTNKDLRDSSNLFPTGVVLPPGMMVPFAGSSAPTSWVLCAGQAISRTGANAGLFAVIGVTYGPGDGTTTFNVPDLRGRTVVGPDSMGGTAINRLGSMATPGLTRGAQSINLDANQLPSHTHTISVGVDSPGHTHTVNSHAHGGATGTISANHNHYLGFQWTDTTATGGTGRRVTDIQNQTGGGGTAANALTGVENQNHVHGIPAEAPGTSDASARHSHSASASATGQGSAVPTVQPSIAINYIIKL